MNRAVVIKCEEPRLPGEVKYLSNEIKSPQNTHP